MVFSLPPLLLLSHPPSLPLAPHRSTSIAEPYLLVTSFGTSGPDGLTVDSLGNLFICHPGLSCVFVVEPTGIPKARIVIPGPGGAAGKAHVTNCIFGSTAADSQTLYFVDSNGAGIYAVNWEAPAGTPLRASNVTTGS
jgi:sugar lactone lactonase YvrE